MLDVQHLSETEKGVGEGQHRRGGQNVDHRDRGHGGIRVIAHVVIKSDRQSLGALRGYKKRSGEFEELAPP